MEYGVFQIGEDQKLILVTKFQTEQEAIDFAKTGVNMVVLSIYS
jgi:hypothetical protein